MAKKKVQKPIQKKKYFKNIKRKKHEAGWVALLKIGVIAFFIFVILALTFGYGSTMPMTSILFSGLQVAFMVIVLIIFIVGLITVSENTINEVKTK